MIPTSRDERVQRIYRECPQGSPSRRCAGGHEIPGAETIGNPDHVFPGHSPRLVLPQRGLRGSPPGNKLRKPHTKGSPVLGCTWTEPRKNGLLEADLRIDHPRGRLSRPAAEQGEFRDRRPPTQAGR